VIVSFSPDGRPGAVLTPLLLDEQGVPRLAVDDDATMVLEKLRDLSAPFGTELSVSGERGHLLLA